MRTDGRELEVAFLNLPSELDASCQQKSFSLTVNCKQLYQFAVKVLVCV